MRNKFAKLTLPIKIISIIISVAFVGGIYYFLFHRDQSFTLYTQSEDVYYKSSQSDSYTKVTDKKISLRYGTFIKTNTTTAHIVFDDNGLMTLDHDTEIQVLSMGKDITIKQLLGKTWHRIKGMVSGQKYTVETSKTVATVRGTKFSVMIEGSAVNMFTTEGIVDIGFINQGSYSNYEQLREGMYSSYKQGDDRFTLTPFPSQLLDSDWYKTNHIIDEKFDQQSPNNVMKDISKTEQDKQAKQTSSNGPETKKDTQSAANKKLVAKQKSQQKEKSVQNNTKTKKEDNSSQTNKPLIENQLPKKDNSSQFDNPSGNSPNESFSTANLSLESLRDKLIQKYHIDVIDQQQCTNVNTEEFSQDLELLLSFRKEFTSKDRALVQYLKYLKTSCRDQNLDGTELFILRSLFLEVLQ